MNKMTLTGPQKNVYEFVAKRGSVEMAQLKSRGLDIRAANNLVKNGILTLTNNVYRIKARKKTGKDEEIPKSAPVKAVPASERAPETSAEGSEVTETTEGGKGGKKAKGDKAAKAPQTKKTVTTATGFCLCGCGTELGPKRRFAQGHDAKLHSIVLKVARGQAGRDALPEACFDKSSATVAYLRGAPWMTDEIREVIGL